MKVLVTGSNGFIGRHLNHPLYEAGHQMVAFDLPDGDVRLSDRVREAMRKHKIEAVINLAGALGTSELIGQEGKAVSANILGAVHCYDACAEAGIPMVQIGTGHRGQPNPYAITKACAEDLGLARARWLGENIRVVRAFHVYGPGQKPAKPYGSSEVRKFFPTFACAALAGDPLELHGGGQQIIDPVYVSEVARLLVEAIGFAPGQVYEAGNGIAVTVRQAADAIADAAASFSGIRVRTLQDMPARPGEPAWAVVKADAPLCDEPWPYAVTETVRWYWDRGWEK